MIPIVDVDLSVQGSWMDAFRPHRRSMKALIRALDEQAEQKVSAAIAWTIKKAISAGNAAWGGLYADESTELAEAAGVESDDIVFANLDYDLSNAGCSTLAIAAGARDGAVLARNLDWTLGSPTLLQRTLVIGRFTGAPAGDYASVLWPGLFGGLTAMAPERFSISINHVTHAKDSGSWALAKGLISGGMPVTWAIRDVLDNARSFTAAVRSLKTVRLASPVLFTIAGTRPGERVAIERSARGAALRTAPRDGGPVLTTNQYASSRLAGFNAAEQALLDDSAERWEGLEDGLSLGATEPSELLKVLARFDVLRSNTHYQVAMNAKAGMLHCRLPGGRTRKVTL